MPASRINNGSELEVTLDRVEEIDLLQFDAKYSEQWKRVRAVLHHSLICQAHAANSSIPAAYTL